MYGAALLFNSIFSTLAVTTMLIALEREIEIETFVMASLQQMPVHYGIIEAIYSRDGSPGTGGP